MQEQDVDDGGGRTTQQQEKSIDDWLPINSSRKAKWWYSAFHNVTAMVGAGVLGLPYAMSELGWGPGIAVMILSWIITLYTLWQMVEMHEMVPGKRFDRYHELGQHVFGDRLGLWIVVAQQLAVEVSLNIIYMVTGGQSLKKFHDVICDGGRCGGDLKLSYFIMIFASVHLREERGRGLPPARHDHPREGVRLPGRPRGRGVRLLGAQRGAGDPGHHPVHAGQAVQEGHVEGRLCRLRRRRHLLLPRHVRRVLGLRQRRRREHPHHALQAQVAHCPRQHDGRRPCHWQLPGTYGTNISLLHIQVTYTPYPCHWLSVQVYAMPVFDMIETVLVKKMRFAPSLTLRLIARSVYVAFTMFLGITFPFFGGLLSFFGGLAFAPTTYFLPCIMWLKVYKPKRFGLSWFINWICIVIGVLLLILGPIGGLRQIILSATTYKFYQ
uniref:Amino acid transporter transmembrane domain-containing protein n=1 Tax=Zea mays TaxID=4577 RepID=A0A804RB94_MAIZE